MLWMKWSTSQRAKEKAEDGARNVQSPPSLDRETGIKAVMSREQTGHAVYGTRDSRHTTERNLMTAGTAADSQLLKSGLCSTKAHGGSRAEYQVRCHGLVLVKTQSSWEQLETRAMMTGHVEEAGSSAQGETGSLHRNSAGSLGAGGRLKGMGSRVGSR